MSSRTTVAVVGAGIAGLGAAWRLARSGFAVAVFERRRAPGGRARSESRDGFALEAAGPLLSTGDRRALAWIDEIGRRDEMLPLRPVVSNQGDGYRVAVVDPRGLSGIGKIPGIRPVDAMRLLRLPRLIGRYGRSLAPDAPERGADLDDRSIGDFGRLYFGRRVLARWLAPFVTGVSLGNAEELSRVLFLRRFRVHAWERPGVLRAPLGELAEAAAAQLNVKYGAEVTRVERRSGGGMSLCVRTGESERNFAVDAVVVATDASEAADIAERSLVTAERKALREVRYQPAISLAIGLRRPFYPHPQLIQLPHGGASPIENVLLEPGLRGGRVPDGRGLAWIRATGEFSAANLGASEEALREDLLAALERIHPNAQRAVLFSRLFRSERALPHFGVGHYRRIARLEKVGRELRADGRRLYLAGDYRMDPSLEGALASAERAVAELAADAAG